MAGAVELRGASAPRGARFRALTSTLLAVPPPVIALGLAAAAIGAHLALWGAINAPPPSIGVAGAGVFALGLAWVAWSFALLRSAGTPVRPRALPVQLIEEGPYRFGRHPMYLGLAAMLGAAALMLGMPLLGLGALAFAAIVRAVHVPFEEAQLLARFGGWYGDYAGTTRRWL